MVTKPQGFTHPHHRLPSAGTTGFKLAIIICTYVRTCSKENCIPLSLQKQYNFTVNNTYVRTSTEQILVSILMVDGTTKFHHCTNFRKVLCIKCCVCKDSTQWLTWAGPQKCWKTGKWTNKKNSSLRHKKHRGSSVRFHCININNV